MVPILCLMSIIVISERACIKYLSTEPVVFFYIGRPNHITVGFGPDHQRLDRAEH